MIIMFPQMLLYKILPAKLPSNISTELLLEICKHLLCENSINFKNKTLKRHVNWLVENGIVIKTPNGNQYHFVAPDNVTEATFQFVPIRITNPQLDELLR